MICNYLIFYLDLVLCEKIIYYANSFQPITLKRLRSDWALVLWHMNSTCILCIGGGAGATLLQCNPQTSAALLLAQVTLMWKCCERSPADFVNGKLNNNV